MGVQIADGFQSNFDIAFQNLDGLEHVFTGVNAGPVAA